MTLDRLRPGESGVIKYVGGQGALRNRLLDMGLTPGTLVSIHKIAPLGDPVELNIRGYELTLRLEDAALIELEGNKEDKNDICTGGQSEQRKNHAFQHSYGRKSACWKLPGRHGGKEKR
jgi:Fe2+ transport system protein FeoA